MNLKETIEMFLKGIKGIKGNNEMLLEGIRLWTKALMKQPLLTGVSTAIGVVAIIFTIIIGIYEEKQTRIEAEAKLRQNLDLYTQLEHLEEVQESLKSLLTFVQHQQEKIKIEQEAIVDLETKKANLEPIIQLKQEQVNKLFELQERRIAKRRWWDLAIGFVLGIVGSAVASVVITAIKSMWQKRQGDRSPNETTQKGI